MATLAVFGLAVLVALQGLLPAAGPRRRSMAAAAAAMLRVVGVWLLAQSLARVLLNLSLGLGLGSRGVIGLITGPAVLGACLVVCTGAVEHRARAGGPGCAQRRPSAAGRFRRTLGDVAAMAAGLPCLYLSFYLVDLGISVSGGALPPGWSALFVGWVVRLLLMAVALVAFAVLAGCEGRCSWRRAARRAAALIGVSVLGMQASSLINPVDSLPRPHWFAVTVVVALILALSGLGQVGRGPTVPSLPDVEDTDGSDTGRFRAREARWVARISGQAAAVCAGCFAGIFQFTLFTPRPPIPWAAASCGPVLFLLAVLAARRCDGRLP